MTTVTRAMHTPRHRHSPRVRRLAREARIDPDTVVGSGTGGRRVFIHDAHNLNDTAITVIDHQTPTEPQLRIAPSQSDRLLTAVIGRTDGSHPTALLVVTTGDARLRDLLSEIEMG